MPSLTRSPTVITDDDSAGEVPVLNPGNAAASDNVYATSGLLSGQSTRRLNSQGYDFSEIPDGSSIDGIVASPEGKVGAGGAAAYVEVRLVVGGSVVGNNKATGSQSLTFADATTNFGGSSDLWGLNPTAAQVKAAGFGCVIRCSESGGEAGATVSIDHTPLTVHFTPPSAVFASHTSIAVALGIGM